MIDVRKIIKHARPDLRDSSLKAYTMAIDKLHRSMLPGQEMDDLKFLTDHKSVIDFLSQYKPTTRKNYLNAIVVMLKAAEHDTPAMEVYEKQRDTYTREYEAEQATNLKNRKQSASWVEWPEYERMVRTFAKQMKTHKLHAKARLKDLNATERQMFGDFVLVSLYEKAPLRNDFHDMEVVNKLPDDNTRNFLLRQGSTLEVVLNNYKTSDKYGTKRFTLPAPLSKLVRFYLDHVNTTGYLLVHEKTGKPMSAHQITTRLQRITGERLDRKISTNMIRHSYLSHKYGSATESMKADSNIMMHSMGTQKMYIKSA